MRGSPETRTCRMRARVAGGDVGELVEHCLDAFETEEDLVGPSTPNFETHLATGLEERKSVGRGDGALAGDSVSLGSQVTRVEKSCE
jgi:hypothetical protein